MIDLLSVLTLIDLLWCIDLLEAIDRRLTKSVLTSSYFTDLPYWLVLPTKHDVSCFSDHAAILDYGSGATEDLSVLTFD